MDPNNPRQVLDSRGEPISPPVGVSTRDLGQKPSEVVVSKNLDGSSRVDISRMEEASVPPLVSPVKKKKKQKPEKKVDELVVDDLPTPKELLANFLKKRYLEIIQQIEIEEEFDAMVPDTDLDEPFIYDGREDDIDDGVSSRASVASHAALMDDDNLEDLLEEEPENKYAHYRLGEIDIQKNEYSERIKYHFTKVFKIDPNYKKHIVCQALGEIYFKDRNYKTSLFYFKESLYEPRTEVFHTLVRLAQCYTKLLRFQNALSTYDYAISVKDFYYLHYKQAKVWNKMGKQYIPKAEACIEKCLQKEPRYFKALCLQATMELDKPDCRLSYAKNMFETVLRAENLTKDKEKRAYIGLARIKEQEGNLTEAMMNTRKALNINPYDNVIREMLAKIYIKTRELKKAIHQYKLILKDERKNDRIYLEIGTLYVYLNMVPAGQRYLEHSIKLNPSSSMANLRLGKLLYQYQRKVDRALDCLKKVTEDPQIGFKANFEMGRIYFEEGIDPKKAIALIKECLLKNPDYYIAWNKLGEIMDKSGNLKGSKQFYEKSLAIEENFMGRLGIATYHFKMKEHEKCDEELGKITSPQYTNDIRCLKLKADNYFQMDRFDEALAIYMK